VTDPADGFPLAHELDGTSYAVRENLVDILERELLGPRDGPEELLAVSPRQLYLVGYIAPEKLAEDRADPAHAEDADGLLAGIRADQASPHAQRGIPVEYPAENTNIELGLLVHDSALTSAIESTMRDKHGILYERVVPDDPVSRSAPRP
jgi:hypothetical protein